MYITPHHSELFRPRLKLNAYDLHIPRDFALFIQMKRCIQFPLGFGNGRQLPVLHHSVKATYTGARILLL
jgi:hypothetical protein